MLKAAGLLGIVLSLGMLGILKSQELKQRIALLQDFWQMMLQLKSEINYLQEPLQSVLRQRPGNAESKAMQLLPARCSRHWMQSRGICRLFGNKARKRSTREHR